MVELFGHTANLSGRLLAMYCELLLLTRYYVQRQAERSWG